MISRILCVDDEPNILHALGRQLRRFDIATALGGERGLETIAAEGPFAVVVSDLRMPGMNGVQFLTKVKERSPDTVRIMLTGQADLSAASQAVNEGNIFRFLLKPCPSEVLGNALDAALEQYRLVNSERDLLEQTLRGAIEVMTEILSLVNPEAFGRASRMRRYVKQMAARLQLPDQWQFEVAAMLSQIGAIAVPQEILDKLQLGETLNKEESRLYASRGQVGHDLLARIPRLDVIARMVQVEDCIGSKGADNRPGDVALSGRRMLMAANAFDDLVISGLSFPAAAAKMRGSRAYDPVIIAALEAMIESDAPAEVRSVRVAQLRPGMVLNADVRSRSGLLLLCKGHDVTPTVIARLRGFAMGPNGLAEPLSVVYRLPALSEDDSRQPVSAMIPTVV